MRGPGRAADRPCSAFAGEPSEPATQQAPAEVTVTQDSVAARLRASEQAVSVVELEEAQRHHADMGDALNSVPGVSIRRRGGLGARANLSLGGFNDNQVAFLFDGVPLEYAGFPFGPGSLPFGYAERVEIYHGVVPARLGTVALGGAVNFVPHPVGEGTRARGAYQLGSFGTQRAFLSASKRSEDSGSFIRAELSLDAAANDYTIDANVADASGQIESLRVRRFHDGYFSIVEIS